MKDWFLRLLPLLMFAPDTGAGEGGAGGDGGSEGASTGAEDTGSEGNKNNEGGAEGGAETTPKQPAYVSQFKKETRDKYKDFSKYATIDDLANAAMSAREDDGSTLRIPGEKATKEEIGAFLKKLGVPETVEGYELPAPQDEGAFSAALRKMLGETMFKNGITKRQGQAMYGVVKAIEDTAVKQAEAARNEVINGFDGRYEALFKDSYGEKSKREAAMKENLGYFSTFVSETGLGQVLKDTGVIYNEAFVKAVGEYAKSVRGSYAGGRGSSPSSKKDYSSTHGIVYGDDFNKRFGGK